MIKLSNFRFSVALQYFGMFRPCLRCSPMTVARLLDRALTALHKLAAKYELPVVATRRQAPPEHGPGGDGDGGVAGRWRDSGPGRRLGQLATARLALSVTADPGHPRSRTRGHRHFAAVRLAADGWAEGPSLVVRLPYD